MTLIPAKQKIASAIIVAAAIAAGALPALRAQSRLPAQGGLGRGDLAPPPASAPAPLSPAAAAGDPQAAALPAALAAPEEMLMPGDDGGQIPLVGAIDNKNNYIAPTGAYRIRIPVYPELGGEINDTQNVATFQDAFGEHYSIGAFPMNGEFLAKDATRGRKDFLDWFFQNYIEADFHRSIPATTHEPNARFNAGTQGGALFTILNIPNGSVYMDRVFVFPPKTPVIAKRGNLLFVRDGYLFVLSTELYERVFEHSTWNKTPAEEEAILRQRLNDLLAHMVFTKPSASATTPAPAPASAPVMPDVTYPAPATTSGTSKAPAK